MKQLNLAGLVRIAAGSLLYFLLLALVLVTEGEAAERFFISIPGPTLSYAPLYYAQEKGFFSQEGLELHVLVVRGIIGVSSLMSGEIDVTCHAGSGFSAALRGIPIKIISVTRDRPVHELIVGPSITTSADLKGKAIAVGSLEGTAAVMTRRILQAKGPRSAERCHLVKHGHPGQAAIRHDGQSLGWNDGSTLNLFGDGSRL
jgi:ABC-type nitrate/sulfonate/bicarbonate transport system substrate-binding protein